MKHLFRNRAAIAALIVTLSLLVGGLVLPSSQAGNGLPATAPNPNHVSAREQRLDLTPSQVQRINIETVSLHEFVQQQATLGNVDFNQDHTVQVYPTAPGKISAILSDLDHTVGAGTALYVIDSPDLQQAESTVIAAAASRTLTQTTLERAHQLYATQSFALKDLQQAQADAQTAEGAYKAARAALHTFGKTEAQIDQLLDHKVVDGQMRILSPSSGVIVARTASLGTWVQPGVGPAPFTVSDLSNVWLIAQVPENDVRNLRRGQPVEIRLTAFPGQGFAGHISKIGAALDPATHRLPVRIETSNPTRELRAGMLASFVIKTSHNAPAPSVSLEAPVREGDGTFSVWVTTDRLHFFKHSVEIGLQQDGRYQILNGLTVGQQVVGAGAIFLSHTYDTETR